MTLSTTSPGDERDRLHAAIMNIPCHPYRDEPEFVIGYKMGHRDARHAAAELAISSTVQQVGAEWISISERLPELGQSVALINVDRWENTGGDLEMNVRACGYLHEMRPGDPYWSIRGERGTCLDAFTHWLPLPSPKSEQGDQQ